MRTPRFVGASIGIALVAVACVDLFHDTDFPTLCATDPAECTTPDDDAAVDASDEVPTTPLCSGDPEVARSLAAGICARLGACGHALGANAFGECMIETLAATDCAARPEMPVRGDLDRLFRCLSRAKSCEDTRGCLFPAAPPQACRCAPEQGCDASFVACQEGENAAVRFVCPVAGGTPTTTESCLLSGTGCVRDNPATARCGVSGACIAGCKDGVARGCDGADVSRNCRLYGQGACKDVLDVGAFCEPLPRQSCAEDTGLTCEGKVARSCVTGHLETVDCARLGLGCIASDRVPLDLTDACEGPIVASEDADLADAGDCTESCAEGVITSCARGATFVARCQDFGFPRCEIEEVPRGASPLPLVARARCVP